MNDTITTCQCGTPLHEFNPACAECHRRTTIAYRQAVKQREGCRCGVRLPEFTPGCTECAERHGRCPCGALFNELNPKCTACWLRAEPVILRSSQRAAKSFRRDRAWAEEIASTYRTRTVAAGAIVPHGGISQRCSWIANDLHRSDCAKRRALLPMFSDTGEPIHEPAAHDGDREHRDLVEWMDDRLGRLSAFDRKVIEKRYGLDGNGERLKEEIAKELTAETGKRVSVEDVRRALVRAMKILAKED